MALFFQTILTLVVADDAGLALPPRTQVCKGWVQPRGVIYFYIILNEGEKEKFFEPKNVYFLILFQFVVYGGFWIATSLLFICLFVACNFCSTTNIASYKEKVRNEGLILNVTNNASNGKTISKGIVIEDGRRDVPVGSTESQ